MNLLRRASGLIVLLFVSACIAWASPTATKPTDEQIVAAMKAETARINREILAAGEDLDKVAKLQRQLQGVFADAMAKLTPRARAAMEVSLKVVDPLLQKGVSYTEALQKQIAAGVFDYGSANTVEKIDHRLKQLAGIEEMNADLIRRVASLDTDLEALMKASTLSAGDKAAFMEGFRSSTARRLGAMRAVRTLDAQLYKEVRGVYGQLREQLGKWSVKDEALVFEEDAQAAIYNARMERISTIAERQEVAMRRVLTTQ